MPGEMRCSEKRPASCAIAWADVYSFVVVEVRNVSRARGRASFLVGIPRERHLAGHRLDWVFTQIEWP
jgi:hypothetical protein